MHLAQDIVRHQQARLLLLGRDGGGAVTDSGRHRCPYLPQQHGTRGWVLVFSTPSISKPPSSPQLDSALKKQGIIDSPEAPQWESWSGTGPNGPNGLTIKIYVYGK